MLRETDAMTHLELLPFSFALVLAASLASYVLSRTNVLRQRTFAWAGMTAGTAMLLLAAALLALGVNIGWRWWSVPAEPRSDLDLRVSIPGIVPRPFDIEAEAIEQRTAARDRGARPDMNHRARSSDETPGQAVVAVPAAGLDGLRMTASNRAVALPRDPWSATQCVVAFQLDPANPDRWTFDNACDQSVAIFIAPCTGSADPCEVRAHGVHGESHAFMLLPAKYLRSVTQAEQTWRGTTMHFEACYAGSALHTLLGRSSELRATPAWRAEYAEALAAASCGGVPIS
jgi:hypothetical protein